MGAALSDNDDLSIFVDFYIILSEEGHAVVVAELLEGNQGAGFEVVEKKSDFCICREFFGNGKSGALGWIDNVSVGDLDGRSCVCWCDVDAVLAGILVAVVLAGGRVEQAGGAVCLVSCWRFGCCCVLILWWVYSS